MERWQCRCGDAVGLEAAGVAGQSAGWACCCLAPSSGCVWTAQLLALPWWCEGGKETTTLCNGRQDIAQRAGLMGRPWGIFLPDVEQHPEPFVHRSGVLRLEKRRDGHNPSPCSRAGWISMLLSKWLRKQCNHPAQGLTIEVDKPLPDRDLHRIRRDEPRTGLGVDEDSVAVPAPAFRQRRVVLWRRDEQRAMGAAGAVPTTTTTTTTTATTMLPPSRVSSRVPSIVSLRIPVSQVVRKPWPCGLRRWPTRRPTAAGLQARLIIISQQLFWLRGRL